MKTYYNKSVYDDDILVLTRRYLGKDWEFTGNIRYVKRSVEADVELECQIKMLPSGFWNAVFQWIFSDLIWCNERYLFNEETVPEDFHHATYTKCTTTRS